MSAAIFCPTCGSPIWRRQESGGYSERLTIVTNGIGSSAPEWSRRVESDQEYGPWECENGHPAPDDHAAELDEELGV